MQRRSPERAAGDLSSQQAASTLNVLRTDGQAGEAGNMLASRQADSKATGGAASGGEATLEFSLPRPSLSPLRSLPPLPFHATPKLNSLSHDTGTCISWE